MTTAASPIGSLMEQRRLVTDVVRVAEETGEYVLRMKDALLSLRHLPVGCTFTAEDYDDALAELAAAERALRHVGRIAAPWYSEVRDAVDAAIDAATGRETAPQDTRV